MERLVGEIKNYAWGSRRWLGELRGDGESAEPEAEIWFGGHATAPSAFTDGSTLLDAIAADPVGQLGVEAADRFGSELPFLVKLLAADSPLSIQAHPNREQALAGFAEEDSLGLRRDAPNRSFRDQNPKPELICALTDFEALVGFRPVEATKHFLDEIGFTALTDQLLAHGPKAVVSHVLSNSSDSEQIHALVTDLVDCCGRYSNTGWEAEVAMIQRLHVDHPGDPGVVVAALLNYVVLDPGESLFLEAGNLHAYINGMALEVMANSDNVLRGGLTVKHIDVPALLEVVLPDAYSPTRVMADSTGLLVTPSEEFSVRRHENPKNFELSGPQVVVSVRGEIEVESLSNGGGAETLRPTEALWIPFGETAIVSGKGLCFSTTVG